MWALSLLSSQFVQGHHRAVVSAPNSIHCIPMTVSTQDNTAIIKYADDITILGLIKGGDESGYRELVNNILAYGEVNDLILNIDKT